MSLCLIVQKDTLENDNIKSVIKTCEIDPNDFLNELQAGHCIEYQLLAHTKSSDVNDKVFGLVAPFKTNYGKDWYELNHDTLAQILSLFLETDVSIINLKSISEIMRFSLKIFPVVNREIRVSSIVATSHLVPRLAPHLVPSLVSSSTPLENNGNDKSDKNDEDTKEEIKSLTDTIRNLEKSDSKKKSKIRNDKNDKNDKNGKNDKNDKK